MAGAVGTAAAAAAGGTTWFTTFATTFANTAAAGAFAAGAFAAFKNAQPTTALVIVGAPVLDAAFLASGAAAVML